MNILIIYPFLLHSQVKHGSGVYLLRLIQALHSLGHQIYLLSLSETDPQPFNDNIQALHPLLKDISIFPYTDQTLFRKTCGYLSSGIPPHISRVTLPLAKDHIRKLVGSGNIDIVYGILSTSGEYLKTVNREKCRTIFDVVELETRCLQMRLRNDRILLPWIKSYISHHMIQNYERKLLKKVDHVIAISSEEKEYILKLSPSCQIDVLNPIVDPAIITNVEENRDQDSILFIGSFHHQPNIDAVNWFLKEVMPRIIQQAPPARIVIVGSQAECANFERSGQSVNIVGEVEDVRPFLQKCAVFVSPIRSGGGARMKNLEALAAGCPLVTTSLGAEGLSAPGGSAYLVADEAEKFAESVVQLLQDHALRKRMGRAGRELVETGHSLKVVSAQLDRLLSEVLEGKASSG